MGLPPDNVGRLDSFGSSGGSDRRTGGIPFRIARHLASLGALYHRAEIEGIGHLPDGAALIVSNHGLYGLDTPVFFYLVWRETGRAPVGLAERFLCALPPMRQVLEELGGVEGTRENALRVLAEGRLVVCYPGGAYEVFKAAGQRHRLCWDRALGFLRVARDAQVPIVPVAGLGIDDTYRVIARLRPLGWLAGHEKYAVPFSLGVGAAPLPARFRFRIGPPVAPPRRDADDDELLELRRHVQGQVEAQLEELADVH